MSEEIEQLRALRGIPKGLVTKIVNWTRANGVQASLYELEVKLEQLTRYEMQFDKVQCDLEMKDPQERDPNANERGNFEDRVASVKARLLELKAIHPDAVNLNETNGATVNVDVVSNEDPKVPRFAGDYADYPEFIDTFNALVHNSRVRGMTEIRKFGILKNSVADKAKDAINNLPMTSENYQEALRILKDRFDKKRLIFEAYIKRLCDRPVAQDTNSLRHLCDTITAVLRGLNLIATPEQIATGILNHLVLTKCDRDTIKNWEEVSASTDELCGPTEFLDFLKKRCTKLETVEYALKYNQNTQDQSKSSRKSNTAHSNAVSTEQINCPLCRSDHLFSDCKVLKKSNPKDRYNLVKNKSRCVRCLNDVRGHSCKALCEKCHKAHHTLLHFETTNVKTSTPKSDESKVDTNQSNSKNNNTPETQATLMGSASSNATTMGTNVDENTSKYTFLATALALFKTNEGNFVTLRILFDGGSQSHLISERAAKLLGLHEQKLQVPLQLRGINSSISLNRTITAHVKSMHHDFQEQLTFVIHRKLHQVHPAHLLDIKSWNIPKLPFADRNFNVPQEVDVILNANQTYQYLLPQQHSLGSGRPILQNTLLGWIVVGDNVNSNNNTNNNPSSCTNTVTNFLTDTLSPQEDLKTIFQKFWEAEALPEVNAVSEMQKECEDHFKRTYSRNEQGKFIVKLPFLKSPSLLGTSYAMALRRLITIKKKIDSDPDYGIQYNEFMDEYISMGHCSLTTQPPSNVPHCYIPHFAVHNLESTTTKTRVVFDASAKTSTGYSLNDVLMVGPTIQLDLMAHLLKFRSNAIAITGDLSKMYRNIEVAEEDRNFQLILWYKDQKISTYRLNTVTYGTASAPFAAIRCLKELAEIEGHDLPLGATTLQNNFYVDDWLGGANTANEAINIHNQLQELLSRGQLTLRKIQSNCPEVMQSIPDDLKGKFVTIGDKEVIKTLGMYWLPNEDVFVFSYKPSAHTKATKRAVLSEIGRLFDPLGLVTPVVIKAKIFMQQLWMLSLAWDDLIPSDTIDTWNRLRGELKEVEIIQFPRFVGKITGSPLEVHGFCDASERAYSACVYIRSIDDNKKVTVRLLIAKSKVAPIKTVSLPRLELLGALLLAELYDCVRRHYTVTIRKSYLWSDSTITLKWITSSPHKWTPYVGTRVTKIQELTKNAQWRHVPSPQNPADIASRGLWPSELVQCELWFNGPSFLREDEKYWPPVPELPSNVPDEKHKLISLYMTTNDDPVAACKYTRIMPLLQWMVWPKLKRVFAYVDRFISRLKSKWRSVNKINVFSKNVQVLSASDIAAGVTRIVKIIQCKYLANELKNLLVGKPVSPQSKLSTLGPMVDKNGVIRVGGRVQNAPKLEYGEKFQVVLPYEHPVSQIIVSWHHVHNLHAPPSSLLSFIRQEFWIIKGKVLANKVVRTCLRCSRLKPIPLSQVMADLPVDRVSEVKRPFVVTAVDFAGPYTVHYKGRGSRTTKNYVAVYVCFSTKAVHLDLVENLSTEAFLQSLQRFVGRRGVPLKLYTDNGKNFIGTRNKLNEMQQLLSQEVECKKIQKWCRDEYKITWDLMPPRTPHFGGLHESAVKIMKNHLTKVVGCAKLSLWEMMTVLAMVEGVMNSRPLVPLSISPQDNMPLTPGHFLIGEPLNCLPEPTASDFGDDYIYRWSKAVAIRQEFWRRWSREYLQSLQCRYKWKLNKDNVAINDLVLLVDENLPSKMWSIGRIVEINPGRDGHVRVVSVKTKTGIYKRGISQLCPLGGPGMAKKFGPTV